MSDKDNIKCCVCQKQFGAVYNLNKHVRKYHAEQVNLIIPKKTYNHQCPYCPKKFSLLKNLNYHKKTHNQNLASDNLSSVSKQNGKCPICKLNAPKQNLLSHFEVEHEIKIVIQTYEFTSFEEFANWKTEIEYNTKSKYVVERGAECTKVGMRTIKYCCHRSGIYNTRGKGIRRLKTQGSNKIDGFCPARLKVVINENKQCKVFFTNQHVGHDENDLGHLFLTLEERKSLANKIALKIPFTQILDDIRDSVVGSPLERIHLLNRKDLSNIEKSLHLQSTVIRHENDAVSVDAWVKQQEGSGSILFYKLQDDCNWVISEDPNISEACEIITVLNEVESAGEVDIKHLAIQKQKVIDNFTQLMETVTDMEQLDAAKKMCIALGATLQAIATKQQLGKSCASAVCSPSNKKITPRRGKLRSTKKKTSKAVRALVTPTNTEMEAIAEGH